LSLRAAVAAIEVVFWLLGEVTKVNKASFRRRRISIRLPLQRFPSTRH
jgi:hypothetical protein